MNYEIGCVKHPEGTYQPCRACGDARLRKLLLEDSRGYQHHGALRRDRKARAAAVCEVDNEHRYRVEIRGTSKLVVHVLNPELITSVRVEVEDGSVVVELDCHAPESIGLAESLKASVERLTTELGNPS